MIKRFFELLSITIVIIGFNIGLLFPKFGDWGIIIASIFFLIWIVVVLTSEERFKFDKFGLTLIFIRIVTPIVSIIFTIIFHKCIYEPQQNPEIIRIEFHADSLDCSRIKYGLFKKQDLIFERININNIDIEIHGKDTFKVVWLDSCSYRLKKRNGFFEIYKIIDVFENRINVEMINSFMKREYFSYEKIN